MLNRTFVGKLCGMVAALSIVCAPVSSNAQNFAGSVGYSAERFSAPTGPVNVEVYRPGLQGQRPAVLVLYGADGVIEHGKEMREAAEGLAKAGYVAFLVHYLDSTGMQTLPQHQQHLALTPQFFTTWMAAVNAGVQYAAAQPEVDASRIGILGFSLGGYLATSTAAVNPQVRAVVEFFGGIPDPFIAAGNYTAPTLIIHGEADTRVSVNEAYKLHSVLSQRGVYNQIKIYPGMGHYLTGDAQEDAKKRVLNFLVCHLGN